MKKNMKLVYKQSVKYFFIIVIALFGVFFGKILWNLPRESIVIGAGVTGAIIIVSLIFDLISVNDVIPIFSK